MRLDESPFCSEVGGLSPLLLGQAVWSLPAVWRSWQTCRDPTSWTPTPAPPSLPCWSHCPAVIHTPLRQMTALVSSGMRGLLVFSLPYLLCAIEIHPGPRLFQYKSTSRAAELGRVLRHRLLSWSLALEAKTSPLLLVPSTCVISSF